MNFDELIFFGIDRSISKYSIEMQNEKKQRNETNGLINSIFGVQTFGAGTRICSTLKNFDGFQLKIVAFHV